MPDLYDIKENWGYEQHQIMFNKNNYPLLMDKFCYFISILPSSSQDYITFMRNVKSDIIDIDGAYHQKTKRLFNQIYLSDKVLFGDFCAAYFKVFGDADYGDRIIMEYANSGSAYKESILSIIC